MKIVISSGHGKNVAGAIGLINEVTEARKVAPRVAAYLRYAGAEVVEYQDDYSINAIDNLSAIVNFHNAQARDLDVSVHFNSVDGGIRKEGIGTETLYYSADALAAKVSKAIADASGLKNRGAKQRTDLGFLAKTTKPAILIEVCFVMSETDVDLYRAHFDGICRAIAGAIAGRELAEQPADVPVMGDSVVGAETLAAFLLSKNPDPKINCSPLELAAYFITEGEIEGVRGDIAFCQSIHETGWFKFGGQVLPDQNNYAGIGAVNNSPVGMGAWFDKPKIGVRGQIQHLKAYACKEPLKQECVDPRFTLVSHGIAPCWLDLNGRWAVPGTTYGQSILKLYDELTAFTAAQPAHWAEPAWEALNKAGIVVHEKRFDEPMTRGEAFSLLAQIIEKR